jgi:hypothetical protein
MAAQGVKLFCVLEYHTSLSVFTVQRVFRAKYAKDLPTDKTIRAWYKQFTETGCRCKQKSSGCPLTDEDDVERFRASFLQGPNVSICQKDFFSFPVSVKDSIKVGLLVFLLQMFVIMENIIKRPVF